MRDYGTWVKQRNKKRCIQEGREDRFALPPSLLPQVWAAQHGQRQAPGPPGCQLVPVAPVSAHGVSNQWTPVMQAPGISQLQLAATVPGGSCGHRLPIKPEEFRFPSMPTTTDLGFQPIPAPSRVPYTQRLDPTQQEASPRDSYKSDWILQTHPSGLPRCSGQSPWPQPHVWFP